MMPLPSREILGQKVELTSCFRIKEPDSSNQDMNRRPGENLSEFIRTGKTGMTPAAVRFLSMQYGSEQAN